MIYKYIAMILSLFGLTQYSYILQLDKQSRFLSNLNGNLNERPIVGIFSQPSPWNKYPSKHYSYISASYVKFIEQSGARVVVIPYNADQDTLETIFQGINGILVPGGATDLTRSKFTSSIAYMLNRAIQANEEGNIFPIMGVCLGHEAIHYILSDYDKNALIKVHGEDDVLHPIENVMRSASLYKDMSDSIFTDFTTQNISYYHHNQGISPDLYKKHEKLNKFLEITGLNQDSDNITYIASTQGIKYPVYTTQYHSEKNPYEWEVPANHSDIAVEITTVHSKAFVNQVRKNFHKFQDPKLEEKYLIYNFPVFHIVESRYTQVFIIPK